MTRRTTITHRQLKALWRAIESMNNVGGTIRVADRDDVLSREEMADLQQRLGAAVQDEPDVQVKIDW